MNDCVGPILGIGLFLLLPLSAILACRMRELAEGARNLVPSFPLPEDFDPDTFYRKPFIHAGGTSEPA